MDKNIVGQERSVRVLINSKDIEKHFSLTNSRGVGFLSINCRLAIDGKKTLQVNICQFFIYYLCLRLKPI